MKEALQALLGHPDLFLGDGRGADAGRAVVPTGFAALDALLPGGGWPAGAVTEILLPREGIGEMRLLLPALVGLAGRGRRIAWIAPPYLPYAPALTASGLQLSRLLVVRAGTDRDRLWTVEQALRSGACGAVLAWSGAGECDDRSLRRLALAAGKGGGLCFLLRPEHAASRPSPAALRLRVAPSPRGVIVELLKGRGGAGRRAEVPLPAGS